MISAFKEILADEIKEGIEKGMEEETKRIKEQMKEQGKQVKAFVIDCLEENFSKEKIIQKLQKLFELDEVRAENYFQKAKISR